VLWSRRWRNFPILKTSWPFGPSLGNCCLAPYLVDHSVTDPDRRAGVIFVLYFGFRQRGAVKEAPVDRLAPAVDVALFHEIQKRASDGGLVLMAHRQIGIVPASENAQPLEIFLVLLDVAQRELPAQLSKLRGGTFPYRPALFLLGFQSAGHGNPNRARKARSAPPCSWS